MMATVFKRPCTATNDYGDDITYRMKRARSSVEGISGRLR